MSKFKVGDVVITNKFNETHEEDPNNAGWDPDMKIFIGKEGLITEITDMNNYLVHDFAWPESALTLVKSADENKD